MQNARQWNWKTWLAGFGIMVIAAGCSGGGEEGGEAPPAPSGGEGSSASAPGGETVSNEPGGVMGKITFTGERPERSVIDVEGDATCKAMHADDPLLSDREVVSEDGGVKWAFVQITNPPEQDYPMPSEPAVLDQVGCRYTPHVMGMRAGQNLEVRNSDDTLHNVRSIARINRGRNFGQPKGSEPRVMDEFAKPEEGVRMKCDIHPWMTGYLFVMDHPYWAVTDENGNYEIDGLPPGEYKVEVWHEKYKLQRLTVTVPGGDMAELNAAYEDN